VASFSRLSNRAAATRFRWHCSPPFTCSRRSFREIEYSKWKLDSCVAVPCTHSLSEFPRRCAFFDVVVISIIWIEIFFEIQRFVALIADLALLPGDATAAYLFSTLFSAALNLVFSALRPLMASKRCGRGGSNEMEVVSVIAFDSAFDRICLLIQHRDSNSRSNQLLRLRLKLLLAK
jgi:hypothetical protein